MSPSPPTPEAVPTHTTYEFSVPLRGGHHSPSQQPNPKIQIPKIAPLPSGPSPAELASGLEGKYVDEFGNILDWHGTVLGRVEGDLPSMVGRPVTATGEIFDVEGEVAGHVSENYSRPNLKPLGTGLSVDDEGKIYDEDGNVVGKLHGAPPGGDIKRGNERTGESSVGAQARPASPPRPDELYLDVKSTFDGIQLIIKIPTVFNRPPSMKEETDSVHTQEEPDSDDQKEGKNQTDQRDQKYDKT